MELMMHFQQFKLHRGFQLISVSSRQNNLDESLESLKNQEGSSANMLLESQILYRFGKMDACIDIYQKLQKSKIDSLEINLVAGLVKAGELLMYKECWMP